MAEDTSKTILDLDAMMDSTLDAVPEAPDFVTPPAGEYVLGINDVKSEKYKPKGHVAGQPEPSRIRMTYKVVNTISSEQAPVANNSLFSETFQGTEQGLGYFKRAAKKILNVDNLDGVPLRDIYSSLKEVQELRAVITISKTPNPAGGEYENVQIRPVHATA